MTILTRQTARRGVTLIEAVLFISVALGLIVGGLVVFQQAQMTARTNDAARSLSAIASEVRALYYRQASFADLDERVLARASGAPLDEVFNTIIRNEWGGRVYVKPNPSGIVTVAQRGIIATISPSGSAPRGRFFEIEYRNVPQGACARLARAKDGVGAFGPGLVSIRFGHPLMVNPDTFNPDSASSVFTVGAPLPNYDENGRLTVTPDQAAAACRAVTPQPIIMRFTLAR